MKIINNTIIYFITTVINQSIPFVLIPIITKEMGTVDVGVLSIFNIFNLVFSTITAFSLNSYFQYIYYRKPKEVGKTIFNILAISLLSNILLGTLNLYFFDNIDAYEDFPKYYAWLIPISSFFSLIYFLYLTYLRNKEKAKEYGLLSVFFGICNLGLSLFLLYTTSLDWESRAIPAIIIPILFGAYTLFLFNKNRWISYVIDYELIKVAFKYSLPFLGIVLLRQMLDYSDRHLLDYFCGKESVGIYDMGYKIGMLVFVAINSFHLVFVPKIYEKFTALEKNKTKELQFEIVSMFYLYLLIVTGLTIAVIIFGNVLFEINYLDPKFDDSIYIYLPIAVSYFFYSLYTMSGVIIGQTFNNVYNLYIVGIGILINAVINYFYIPVYGEITAAISTLITFIVMCFLSFIIAKRMISLPWFAVESVKWGTNEIKRYYRLYRNK